MKKKILWMEFEGLPTVGENSEKMKDVREKLTLKVHAFKMKGIASMIAEKKLIESSKDEKKEMKNVTPGVIDVTFKKIEEKKEESK